MKLNHQTLCQFEKVQLAMNRAYLMAKQSVVQPTAENAIEVRVSIEKVQYCLDQIVVVESNRGWLWSGLLNIGSRLRRVSGNLRPRWPRWERRSLA